jgi:hypothetical protein
LDIGRDRGRGYFFTPYIALGLRQHEYPMQSDLGFDVNAIIWWISTRPAPFDEIEQNQYR